MDWWNRQVVRNALMLLHLDNIYIYIGNMLRLTIFPIFFFSLQLAVVYWLFKGKKLMSPSLLPSLGSALLPTLLGNSFTSSLGKRHPRLLGLIAATRGLASR